jgi:hypothetical protein
MALKAPPPTVILDSRAPLKSPRENEHEILARFAGSTKSETSMKHEIRMAETFGILWIRISNLFRISDFGFRITDPEGRR